MKTINVTFPVEIKTVPLMGGTAVVVTHNGITVQGKDEADARDRFVRSVIGHFAILSQTAS